MQNALSTPARATSPARAAPRAPLSSCAIACILVAAFVVASAVVAFRKDVRDGFDEVAHVSYVADMQRLATAWPRLTDLRMLEPDGFRFTGDPSYINHPPIYYFVLARLGPSIVGNVRALPIHRLMNVAMAALAFAMLVLLAGAAKLPRVETLALVAPMVMIPVLPAIAGAVNNDNAAFAAGALSLLGLHRLIATGNTSWLMVTLAALVLAGAAKLNTLMLVGGATALSLAYLVWRGRFRVSWIAPIGLALILAAAPYIALTLQYGSPAPHTPGQQLMLESLAQPLGWSDAPRMSPVRYAAYFVVSTLEHWAPTLLRLNEPLAYATLVTPLGAVVCGLVGGVIALRRVMRGSEGALDVVVAAGWIAIIGTLMIHMTFSYQRHVATGWMLDTYPRYYIALFAVVPLAGIVVLSAMRDNAWRRALAATLIASPVAFNFLCPLLS